MTIFDLLMTFIEDLTISIVTFNSLKISLKKITLVLITLLAVLLTYFFNNYFINNLLLLIVLLCFYTSISFISTKKFDIYYFIIPLILISILMISNIFSSILISLIFKISPSDISKYPHFIIYLSILSRIIFILFTSFFYNIEKKYKLKNEITISYKYWISFCVFAFSFLGSFTVIYETIFYGVINYFLAYRLLILFIIMGISFFVLYFNIQYIFKSNLRINEELMKSHFSHKILKKTNKLAYQILNEKHQILYILIKIKFMLNQNENKDNIIQVIDKNITKFENYKFSTHSSNILLNQYVINPINILKEADYDIKSVITVSTSSLIDNENVLEIVGNSISNIAEYCKITKKFELRIYDRSSYLIVKLSFKNIGKLPEFYKKYYCQNLVKTLVSNYYDITEIKYLFKEI